MFTEGSRSSWRKLFVQNSWKGTVISGFGRLSFNPTAFASRWTQKDCSRIAYRTSLRPRTNTWTSPGTWEVVDLQSRTHVRPWLGTHSIIWWCSWVGSDCWASLSNVGCHSCRSQWCGGGRLRLTPSGRKSQHSDPANAAMREEGLGVMRHDFRLFKKRHKSRFLYEIWLGDIGNYFKK